jgi:hypothetical protein
MEQQSKIDNKMYELLNSDLIKQLRRFYPIHIWSIGGNIFVTIDFRDKNGKLVDILTLTADENGKISVLEALYFIVIASQMSFDEIWKAELAKQVRRALVGIKP